MKCIRLGLATVGFCLSLASASAIGSQDGPVPSTGAQAGSTSSPAVSPPAVSQGELDQMLAGIALYPDDLLSQVLMASTYPLEIVQADRWASANGKLNGDALTSALEKQDWDPSVKSLVNFPEVLSSLSENLTWTQKIGDAFLTDQKSVMDTVQTLRQKAKDAGNLESSKEMTISTETVTDDDAQTDGDASADGDMQVIVIKSADPQVIYVPAYDPAVVYSTWLYPAYPPPVYYRPPYYHSGAALAFGVGVTCGLAWGYAWGGCGWGHHNVNVNVNRNVNINANINRNRYKTQGNGGGRGSNSAWKHDQSHRKGVPYRDKQTASNFGGISRAQAQQSRDSFRGHAQEGRSQLSKDRASGRIDSSGRERSSGRASDGIGSSSRGRSAINQAQPSRATSRSQGMNRSQGMSRSGGRSGAFGDSGRGISASRDSARGRSSRSRSSAGRSRGGRARGGRARGGRR